MNNLSTFDKFLIFCVVAMVIGAVVFLSTYANPAWFDESGDITVGLGISPNDDDLNRIAEMLDSGRSEVTAVIPDQSTHVGKIGQLDIIRFIDGDAKVVCWIISDSISCLPVSETDLAIPEAGP